MQKNNKRKKVTHKKVFLNSLVGSFLGVLIGTLLVIFVIFPAVSISSSSLRLVLSTLAIEASRDPGVDFIKFNCEGTDLEKVYCVAIKLDSYYNYNLTRDKNLIKSLTEMLMTGGICRDFSVNYCSVMYKMNIKCDYIILSNHLVSYVDLIEEHNTYCIIDQGEVWCA